MEEAFFVFYTSFMNFKYGFIATHLQHVVTLKLHIIDECLFYNYEIHS